MSGGWGNISGRNIPGWNVPGGIFPGGVYLEPKWTYDAKFSVNFPIDIVPICEHSKHQNCGQF